jgi:hypothetical protein
MAPAMAAVCGLAAAADTEAVVPVLFDADAEDDPVGCAGTSDASELGSSDLCNKQVSPDSR